MTDFAKLAISTQSVNSQTIADGPNNKSIAFWLFKLRWHNYTKKQNTKPGTKSEHDPLAVHSNFRDNF